MKSFPIGISSITFVPLPFKFTAMKSHFRNLFFSLLLLTSCQDNKDQRLVENTKDAKKQALIFATIDKGWNFNTTPTNATSQQLRNSWSDWRIFINELSKKPKSTIGAFQKRAKILSEKAAALKNEIPNEFNKPEIKSRISALTAKINMLNLYINLDAIPAQKVVSLIPEINIELAGIQSQMDEIVRKKNIPIEEGESDIIRMRDPSRAITE